MTKAALKRIKKATVALAFMHEQEQPLPMRKQPFTILGSGFCIHRQGVVVTCAHVIEAFMEKNIKEHLDSIPSEEKSKRIQNIPETRSLIPHALFYLPRHDRHEMHIITARVDVCTAKTNMDLGALRLHPHAAFPQGYPVMRIEDFDHVHEGLEIATCGFPLGNLLFEQLGTVTSSFTRGIVSSIIPAEGASLKDVTGFQLDLRVTHGNSGGPVFSWKTGRVFGVLQSGLSDQRGQLVFSRAESVYRLLEDGFVERLLTMPRPEGF